MAGVATRGSRPVGQLLAHHGRLAKELADSGASRAAGRASAELSLRLATHINGGLVLFLLLPSLGLGCLGCLTGGLRRQPPALSFAAA